VTKKDMVKELNTLLKSRKLNLPSFRREVTVSGRNVHWLNRNIRIENEGYNKRIDELLNQLIAA
jgi:hypothetical protein